MSKRGKGTCTMCRQQYANKYKPEYCPCGAFLGGQYVPQKKKKMSAPEAVEIIRNVFSAKTSSRNDRCLVVREGEEWICLHGNCLKDRATFVSAGNAEGFACKHINLLKTGTVAKPVDVWTPATLEIDSYDGGPTVQTRLKDVVQGLSPTQPAVITVCENRFVVYGPPTATNTMGYCHIRKEEANLLCTSKDCKACVARCKSEKHLLLMYNKVTKKIFNPQDESPANEQTAADPETSTSSSNTATNSGEGSFSSGASACTETEQSAEEQESKSRKSTLELISKRPPLPYQLTKQTHKMIDDFDAISHLGVPVVGQVGWPSEFAPDEGNCGRCGSPLGPLRLHPGSKGENKGKAYLVTNMNPFQMISISVRFCTNCKAMHQAETQELGEPVCNTVENTSV